MCFYAFTIIFALKAFGQALGIEKGACIGGAKVYAKDAWYGC